VTRVKQLALGSAILAAAAGTASAAYQRIGDTRDRRQYPPPGRLIRAGGAGRRLHLYEAGEGTPTVVIIPALNCNVLEWMHIVRELQQDTQVCVYDRAGIGWSDPPQRARRTIEGMAGDLHTLLAAAGLAPPFIIAGHSLGGVVARRFAADYPEQVCGLVLVDSSHENQAARFPWREGAGALLLYAMRWQARILGTRRLAATFGLMPGLDAAIAREVPPEYMDAARSIALSTHSRRTTVAEMLLAVRLRNEPPDLGSLLLAVLTRQPSDSPVWSQLQDELAALSTSSQHLYARHAGHNIHLDEPEVVIEAIREMIRKCRLASA
jgi:pimeloyl-ACP methyl ester carboxylesterase